jgi:hypothetical protein
LKNIVRLKFNQRNLEDLKGSSDAVTYATGGVSVGETFALLNDKPVIENICIIIAYASQIPSEFPNWRNAIGAVKG